MIDDICVCFRLGTKVFLVPVSVTAVNGSTVEFNCTASNTDHIEYRVNGTPASDSDAQKKGFIQLGDISLGGNLRRRNLRVTVSSQYNNTKIVCRANGSQYMNSETANLTVQGNYYPLVLCTCMLTLPVYTYIYIKFLHSFLMYNFLFCCFVQVPYHQLVT